MPLQKCDGINRDGIYRSHPSFIFFVILKHTFVNKIIIRHITADSGWDRARHR